MINPADLRLDSLPWVPLDGTAGFPAQPGIYFAIDANGIVQYIGRTKDVRGRWKNHHRFDDLSAIGGIKIAYLFIDLAEILPETEQALIAWFDPKLNVIGRSFKVAQWAAVEVPKPVDSAKFYDEMPNAKFWDEMPEKCKGSKIYDEY